jgi:hypothetical protein
MSSVHARMRGWMWLSYERGVETAKKQIEDIISGG